MSRPYVFLGIIMSLSGAVLCPIFYFVANSPALTSVSLSAVMLGFTAIALANARPFVSPEACRMLLATGIENTAALLEELELRSKAVYMPSISREKPARALIPLNDGVIPSKYDYSSDRLVIRYDRGQTDLAIAVTTPGTTCIKLLETRPASGPENIEYALNYLLIGVLDIADSVSVRVRGRQYSVRVQGNRLPVENLFYQYCLGSPVASISAAVASYAEGRPVTVFSEEPSADGKNLTIELEVAAENL